MAKQGNIKFGVQFQVDKAGLKTIETELKRISNMSVKDVINSTSIADATSKLNAAKTAATQMQQALEAGFNVKLNTVNLEKFQQSLKDSGTSLNKLQADLSHVEGGTTAFRNMTAQLLTTNKHLRESSELLTKMGNTLANTIRWSIASTAINSVTGSIQKAWSFTKQLDTSLNDIMIVTGKSSDEMERFAVKANKAAKELGASTKAYSDASLIYYQQGLSDQEVAARAGVTVKAANVTGQSAQQVSEQLTAVWNGYKVSAQESEIYIDKLAAVAAKTAADLEELSTGMSRVASAANIMGVDIDQLNAQLATIVSVTREAPESIGTALKTVYARMSDLEAGLDAETTLGEYTKQMANFGIQALDANGKLRDMGDVVEEIGNRWNTLSRNQQVALAQTIAGTRQYSRMTSLFDNWDMYQDALKTSKGSAGTLQKQQDTYMESTEAHLEKLGATAEDLYASLFNTEDMNDLIDILAKLVDGVDNFVEAIGGGASVLRNFGAIAVNVFNKQIANSAARAVTNVQGFFDNQAQEKAQEQLLRDLNIDVQNEEGVKEILRLKNELNGVEQMLTKEQKEQGDEYIKQTAELYKQKDSLTKQVELARELTKVTTDGLINLDADASKWTAQDTIDAKITLESHLEAYQQAQADRAKLSTDLYLSTLQSKRFSRSALALAQKDRQAQLSEEALKSATSNSINAQRAANDQGMIESQQRLEEAKERNRLATEALLQAEQKYNAVSSESRTQAKDFIIVLEGVQQQYDTLINTEYNQVTLMDSLSGAQKKQANEAQIVINKYKQGNASVEQYIEALRTMFRIFDQGEDNLKSIITALDNLSSEVKKNKQDIKNAGDSFEYFSRSFDTKKIVSNITTVTSSITSLISAVQTLSSLDDIWNNDDLTTGEKFAQTLMNISMAVGILIPGLISLGGLITKNTKSNFINAISELAVAFATKKRNKEKAKTATDIATETTDKETLLNNIKAAKESGKISGKEAGGMASQVKKGNKLSSKSLGKLGIGATTTTPATAAGGSGSATIAAVGNIAVFGAAAAAIAAVIAGIYLINKLWNTASTNLENAQKKLETFQETQNKVNQELSDMQSLISAYEEARKSVEELTKGSTEWAEALKEANKNALELIRTYPELVKYMSYSASGEMIISNEGLDFIEQQKEIDVTNASRNVTFAQQQVREAEIELLKTNLLKDADQWATSYYVTEEGGSMFKGSVYDPELEKILNNLSPEDLADYDTFKDSLKSLEIENEKLASNLWNNSEALINLMNAVQENNTLLKAEAQQTYLSMLDSYGYTGTDKGAIAALAAIQDTDSSEEKAIEIDRIAAIDKKSERDFYLQQYGELANLDISEWKQTGGNTVKYKDSEGKTHSIEWRDIAELVGTNNFQQNILSADNIKVYRDQINKIIQTSGFDYIEDTQEVLTAIIANQKSAVDEEVLEDFSQDTITGLKKSLSNLRTVDDPVLKNAIETTIINLEDAWKTKLVGEIGKSFDQMFNTLKDQFEDITFKQKQKLENIYQSFDLSGGKDATTSLQTFLETLGESATKFVDTIDFTSKTLEADIFNFLKEENISSLNMTNKALSDFIWQVRLMGDSVDETQERLKTINSAVSNINKGDIISQEEYDTLYNSYGEAMDKYFSRMEDGTYRLTESVRAFRTELESLRQEEALHGLENAIANFEEGADKLSKAQQHAGYNTLTAAMVEVTDEAAEEAKRQEAIAAISRRTIQEIQNDGDIVEFQGASFSASDVANITSNYNAWGEAGLNQELWKQFVTTDFAKQYGYDTVTTDQITQWSGDTIAIDGKGNLDSIKMLQEIDYQARVNAAKQAKYGQTRSTKAYQKSDVKNVLDFIGQFNEGTIAESTLDAWETELNNIQGNSIEATNTTVQAILEAQAEVLNNLATNDSAQLEQWATTYFGRFSDQKEAKAAYDTLIQNESYSENTKNILTKVWNDQQSNIKLNELNKQLEAYETQLEAIEAINSEYEQMNSLLEHQRSLIELTAGENAYSEIGKVLTAQIDTIEDQLTNSRNAAAYWQNQMAQALADNQTELYEAAKANWEDASNAYYENMSQKIELLKEEYLNSVDVMFAAQEKLWTGGVLQDDGSIKGGYSMDYLEAEWDITQKRNDAYLDPVNAEFEKLKIENKYSTAFNDAQSLNAQKRIKDLMEDELSVLEDKDKLSEYDLKRAEARLEVTKAQIALEEAQANKSKMRLTRSADGTYSYQYVADVDAVTKAQETLAQAQQDLYNLDVDEYEANLEEALSLYQEYKEKMREISQIADKDEREAQMDLLQEQFGGLLTDIFGDNESIKENLTASFGMAASGLGEDFGDIKDAVAATNTQLTTFVESMNFETLSDKLDDLETPWDKIKVATEEWSSHLKNAQAIVTNIADTMKSATWGENSSLKLTSFTDTNGKVTESWDSEAISKDIATSLTNAFSKIKLKEVEDENGKIIGWNWVSAATGMYTGEWGPEGKLAVLHEKELVLNKTDTANILQAVDMIRTLENALSASMFENILSKMGGNGNPLAALDLAKDLNLEQNVHITAEFPNATDKSEIEAAFDELLNLATQQVFENKRE